MTKQSILNSVNLNQLAKDGREYFLDNLNNASEEAVKKTAKFCQQMLDHGTEIGSNEIAHINNMLAA